MAWVKRVSGSKTSLSGAGGTMALRSGAVSETSPASETYFTLSLGSAKRAINCWRISSGEWPGKMRQLTLACAVCGEGVVGVAGGEARGDAGGAEVGVEAGFGAEACGSGHVGRRGEDGADVGCAVWPVS